MEYETLMMSLRAKDEQAAEMKRTRAQLRKELEQFKSELDLQIQEERKRLKEELEESQRVTREFWTACIFIRENFPQTWQKKAKCHFNVVNNAIS